MSKKKKEQRVNSSFLNKKVRRDYFIEDEIEAGIALTGSEVKSLRSGKADIEDAYAEEKDGEIFLINSYIAEYPCANLDAHHPRRKRKLLLHRTQINKLCGKAKSKGFTIVPLKLYFNEKNKAKILIGLAKGKTKYDKRESEKKKDWDREKSRLMKEG